MREGFALQATCLLEDASLYPYTSYIYISSVYIVTKPWGTFIKDSNVESASGAILQLDLISSGVTSGWV